MVRFYDRYFDLKNVGFEVGVAIPSVSNEFSLKIKIGRTIKKFNTIDDISFVLNVLNICFEKATPNENTFWRAYCEFKKTNFKLTKENLNLNSVINILKNAKKILPQKDTREKALFEAKPQIAQILLSILLITLAKKLFLSIFERSSKFPICYPL